MAKKKKYYVVWSGKVPGIYDTWEEAEPQVKGVVQARYKGYSSRAVAEEAFRVGPELAQSIVEEMSPQQRAVGGGVPEVNAIAVDAACSGNPGVMEYQGVYVATRTRLFHFQYPMGTNNIGEFLAIVHGLAYMQQHGLEHLVLYSDSVNAQNWVRAKRCRTKLPLTAETSGLYDIIHRAEAWLHGHEYSTRICKWDTEHWGEIPADFGRK